MKKDQTVTEKSMVCAYCKGKGRDPFGLLSPLATCQVCAGKGRVVIAAIEEERITTCPYCRGSGRHPFTRMSCTVCLGKGVVLVDKDGTQCPSCRGSGAAGGKAMPCSICSGRGVVEPATHKHTGRMV